ncbi:MAG: MBL fold metallo-hydrolase, partial [Thiogranum sp.]
MLRLKQAFALILWLPFAALAETAPEVPDYPADRIAENIYVIHGPLELPNPKNQGFMNNPGFVVTSKGVVILDPG